MRYYTLFEGIKENQKAKKTRKVNSSDIANLKDLVIFENEDGKKEELPLKKAIARLTYLYSVKALNTDDSNRIRFNTAILLLNQAQTIADSDRAIATKLYNQARKLFRKK